MTRNNTKHSPEAVLKARTGVKWLKILIGSLSMVALCVAIRYHWGAESASADPSNPNVRRTSAGSNLSVRQPAPSTRPKPSTGRAAPSVPEVVATVNTQRVSRGELAEECLRHYGEEVLESMVNKRLIVRECRRRKVRVTQADVNAEIERMAKRFGIPVDQWLKMLEQERHITSTQYANDIIWPTLALRSLAGRRLTVSREELVREFETRYGEAIRARLISVSDPSKAKALHARATADPEGFGNLAKDNSEDAPSASAKGVINPIRKHGSYKEIEQAAFTMADGEVSQVIHAGGQYVILKREGVVPARHVQFEQVAAKLEEVLRERKMRTVAQDVFRTLQKNATIENVWNDPAKRAKMPGVAAKIDNDQIMIRELAEECIARHGREVLEGLISRKILEQACKKQGITVTEADIDQEIVRAAAAGVKLKPDGSPDVDAWMRLVTEKQGVSLDVYRNDVVWPSVALKKLASEKVEVTEADLRKGFEANYGPRVRCLAIVLDNQRRAQEVFEMARKKNTSEHFGDLASQYSVEPGSQALRGEVPPIKKHGGQPALEREAFSLKPGEISGVIQIADKFILLRCENYTKPIRIAFEEVRQDIYNDLHEKKLRLAMAERFEQLQESASVDNYLVGTSHSPKRSSGMSPTAKVPTFRQVPGG